MRTAVAGIARHGRFVLPPVVPPFWLAQPIGSDSYVAAMAGAAGAAVVAVAVAPVPVPVSAAVPRASPRAAATPGGGERR